MASDRQTESNNKSQQSWFRFNVGTIIFVIIFLYIIFSVYAYLSREQIRHYEVMEGNIVRQKQYTGFAIREEEAVAAPQSGSIHYYIQDGRRVAAQSNVYVIDQSNKLHEFIQQHPELAIELNKEQISDIRYRLSQFSKSFKNEDFYALYDIKYSLDASALEFSSFANSEDLDAMFEEGDYGYTRVPTEKSGIVSYATDGYEGVREADVTAEMFSTDAYNRHVTKPGETIEEGNLVYKLITSPNWSIVFPISDEEKERYQILKSVRIYFTEKNLTGSGTLSVYTATDGNDYGKISMNSLMEEFCGERLISFEIMSSNESGLKIPVTSIVDKDFYIVPKDFLISENDIKGFIHQKITEDGITQEFTKAEIYRIDNQYCYLSVSDTDDLSQLKTGDVLFKKDTGETYTVGPMKPIKGVYNINKGFCVFRQIVPIEANNEYVIIEKNTDYGLSVYDHIVLDASLVREGQLIYQ